MTDKEKKPPHRGAGHRQRLRARFLRSGLDGFHDYEVIELLLTLGMPRKDCKASAKAALERFKTLQAVLEAEPDDLCKVPGIGPRNLFGLKLIPAVSRRYLRRQLEGKTALSNSRELFRLPQPYHSGSEKRMFRRHLSGRKESGNRR